MGREIYILQRNDGVPLEHIYHPGEDAQARDAMERYHAIADAMNINEAPHLIVIPDMWWPFTHIAHFKPKTNTITLKQSDWQDFATGKTGTAGEYIIRHELGHVADKEQGLNRRTFLGGLLASTIRPAATLGGATVMVKAGNALHGDNAPRHPLEVIGEASVGGVIGHKAATPLAKWAKALNRSRKEHIEEMTADRHACTDLAPIEIIRGILALSKKEAGFIKDLVERAPPLRARVSQMAKTLQEKYPVLSVQETEDVALLEYFHKHTSPSLQERFSTDPHRNGDYPSPYERIMALLAGTQMQGRSR